MASAPRDPHGPRITDATTRLHRQIRPDWLVSDSEPSSQSFQPKPNDFGLMSFADGRVQSQPEEAWRFHTETLGFVSAAVVTLSVGDFDAHPDGAVPVHEDRLSKPRDDYDHDAHAVADVRTLGNSARKRLAAHLKARVMGRVPVFSYRPPA